MEIVLKENHLTVNDVSLNFPFSPEQFIKAIGEEPSRIVELSTVTYVWDKQGVYIQPDFETRTKVDRISFIFFQTDFTTEFDRYPKGTYKGNFIINGEVINFSKVPKEYNVFDFNLYIHLENKKPQVLHLSPKVEIIVIDYSIPLIPVNESIPFSDFNFKLLVIDELMYKQKVLEPVFNYRDFTDFYTQRKIDIEKEGYEIIPEIATYFKGLPIPKKFATLIEKLTQNGNIIYFEIFPFWDGDDDTFDIKSAEDAVHFPNLKKITIFPNETMDETVINQFLEKGIHAEFL